MELSGPWCLVTKAKDAGWWRFELKTKTLSRSVSLSAERNKVNISQHLNVLACWTFGGLSGIFWQHVNKSFIVSHQNPDLIYQLQPIIPSIRPWSSLGLPFKYWWRLKIIKYCLAWFNTYALCTESWRLKGESLRKYIFIDAMKNINLVWLFFVEVILLLSHSRAARLVPQVPSWYSACLLYFSSRSPLWARLRKWPKSRLVQSLHHWRSLQHGVASWRPDCLLTKRLNNFCSKIYIERHVPTWMFFPL